MNKNVQLIITHVDRSGKEPATSLKTLETVAKPDSRKRLGYKRVIYGHLKHKDDQDFIERKHDNAKLSKYTDDFVWDPVSEYRSDVRFRAFNWGTENVSHFLQMLDNDMKKMKQFNPSNRDGCGGALMRFADGYYINRYFMNLCRILEEQGLLVGGPGESEQWLLASNEEPNDYSYDAPIRSGGFVHNVALHTETGESNPWLLGHQLRLHTFEDSLMSHSMSQKQMLIRDNHHVMLCKRTSHLLWDEKRITDLSSFVKIVGESYARVFYKTRLGRNGPHRHIFEEVLRASQADGHPHST